jgi:hypothetical protein
VCHNLSGSNSPGGDPLGRERQGMEVLT